VPAAVLAAGDPDAMGVFFAGAGLCLVADQFAVASASWDDDWAFSGNGAGRVLLTPHRKDCAAGFHVESGFYPKDNPQ
jgi:hypothetical protein